MGAGTKIKTGILLAVTILLYAVHCILASLAATGNPTKFFPRSVGNASDIFKVLITPVGATFSIWGVIYFLQFVWLVYALVSLCRSGTATNLLSGKFYGCFILSTVFITTWFFTWTRLEALQSLIMLVIQQLFLEVAFGLACSNLREYLQARDISSENKSDVWCQRILVQNGILFYLTWTLAATMLSFSIVLNRDLDVSDQSASLASLVILTIVVVGYFVCESWVFPTYTEYTVSFYIGLIWAFSGIFSGVWGENDVIGGYVLALLILSCILLVVRIVIIVMRHRRRSYETIGYNADTEAITT